MRKIKFRVWDEPIKAMTYMNDWEQILMFRPCMYEEGFVMQYTGLKDKDGVDIYEEDICIDEENMLWEVIFIEGMYKLENIHIPGRRFILNDIKVIGNRYENEDLINED